MLREFTVGAPTPPNPEDAFTTTTAPANVIVSVKAYSLAALETKKDMGSYRDNLLHATLGLSDESGELSKAVKNELVYGKKKDIVNLVEELGDAMWFINLGADTIEVPLAVVMEANIAKLQVRYSEGYADAKALGRVTELEREAIEQVLTNYGIEY